MKESNFKKLIDAGFRIFRVSNDGYEIRELQLTNYGHTWSVFMSYKTKKACAQSFAELIKFDKHLEA